MPFTPFHFGPGLLIKSADKRLSLLIFIFSQIVMDVEPLYFLLRDEYPVHRLLHTYGGCNLAVLITIFMGKPLCDLVMKTGCLLKNAKISEAISWKSAAISAFAGAYSHVFLDSLMHFDMKPFWPFTDGNPMLGFMNIRFLYFLCSASAVAGLVFNNLFKEKGSACGES